MFKDDVRDLAFNLCVSRKKLWFWSRTFDFLIFLRVKFSSFVYSVMGPCSHPACLFSCQIFAWTRLSCMIFSVCHWVYEHTGRLYHFTCPSMLNVIIWQDLQISLLIFLARKMVDYCRQGKEVLHASSISESNQTWRESTNQRLPDDNGIVGAEDRTR